MVIIVVVEGSALLRLLLLLVLVVGGTGWGACWAIVVGLEVCRVLVLVVDVVFFRWLMIVFSGWVLG